MWIKTLPPAVAADVMAARKRPIRFVRLGRFVLLWESGDPSHNNGGSDG